LKSKNLILSWREYHIGKENMWPAIE